jgi:dGTPase
MRLGLSGSPVRRLGDETQVSPLERNEPVRNRLMHSHEVSNLARSIGAHLVHSDMGAHIVAEARETFGSDCDERVWSAISAISAKTRSESGLPIAWANFHWLVRPVLHQH